MIDQRPSGAWRGPFSTWNGAIASTSSENGCPASKRPKAVGSVEGTLFDLERSDSEYQQRKRVPRKQATKGRRERDT